MSSLDRLIDLAQQTGDRLIVHDPIEGRDIVIMDVDEYEKLVFSKGQRSRDLGNLSSVGMLEKINRDIAVWRARRDEEDEWEKEWELDEEVKNEPPFDPFREIDSHVSGWHSAGSVLGDRYGGGWDSGFDDEEGGIDSEEIKIEDVPFGSGEEKTAPEGTPLGPVIPLAKSADGDGWKEEPLLEEEPVFYEEPV